VNDAFFGLTFTAALNPKLLGADLLIREPPAAGHVYLLPCRGLTMSITIGIVDVLFVQADAVKTEGSVSASVDLALGLCLLVSERVMRFFNESIVHHDERTSAFRSSPERPNSGWSTTSGASPVGSQAI
jgi:hypothetical protein